MKTIDKLSFVPLLALLLFAGSCEKDGGVFMRENDAIACDCTEQSISQNVLCDGEWVADCGDVEWIAITPERGSGNGKDYGFFTLNIQYNSGAERTATVHLVYDGAAYPITVTQARASSPTASRASRAISSGISRARPRSVCLTFALRDASRSKFPARSPVRRPTDSR